MFKRLFVGLELPEGSRHLFRKLDPQIKGLRWLPPEQLHLTMSFIGDVDAEHEEQLRGNLAQVRVSPFFLPITGVGAFGGERPSVVWAGVGKGHPHLFALHQHIQDAVLHAGLDPDLKPFHPHITLGRARGVSRAALKPFLRDYQESEFDLWKVTSFTLFSSRLTAEGSIYTVELRQELQ
ncbi:2'-5' RNA ligase [Chthoniobacter flavus Ellin428]|uniref:RNA 2',3'-cyclic phosphodiesterase n=1 Tax=Chthoniobacter flavus Ellin428 TaxID=497964 RepID=B4D614_9BACT|nr:RNA 2',3'-cyclic phosphodiesterase [Chthoniobacter flavus]EDY18217.1 2'-5' RNA ligase [Chthoniobacter flavus Ellin428]TCO91431.1 2'-5' RNA ligase [Chthoniobacter flavus]